MRRSLLLPALAACSLGAPAIAEGHLALFAQIEALADVDGPTAGALEGLAQFDIDMTEDCAVTFTGALVSNGAVIQVEGSGSLIHGNPDALSTTVSEGEQAIAVPMAEDHQWTFVATIPAEHPEFGPMRATLEATDANAVPGFDGSCDDTQCSINGASSRAEIPLANLGETDLEDAVGTFRDLVTACTALQ